jgi:hypothetical protein
MFRVALGLALGLCCAGCVSREFMQELREKEKARIEAARIPEVQLSEAQMTKLREYTPKGQISWLGAGRQSDGQIFVCHVVPGKTRFGDRTVALLTGTFDGDGPYERTWAHIRSERTVLQECHSHGFDPPVTITTSVSTMRIR